MTLTALDILKAARAKIAKPEDWGQGRRSNRVNFDSCCTAEAIEECSTANDLDERVRAYSAIRHAAGLDDRGGAIVAWNDAPKRTHAQVLAAYDRAIDTMRRA